MRKDLLLEGLKNSEFVKIEDIGGRAYVGPSSPTPRILLNLNMELDSEDKDILDDILNSGLKKDLFNKYKDELLNFELDENNGVIRFMSEEGEWSEELYNWRNEMSDLDEDFDYDVIREDILKDIKDYIKNMFDNDERFEFFNLELDEVIIEDKEKGLIII